LAARINKTPANFAEWRLANRRLCDMWLIPLSTSPRALLIWLRFFHTDEESALDIHDSAIDETDLSVFIWQLIFVPTWPLVESLAKYIDKDTYMDDVFRYVLSVRLGADVLEVIALTMDPFEVFARTIVAEMYGVSSAFFSYYVLWYITPLFLLDFLFYSLVFVGVPLYALFKLMTVVAMLGLIGTPNLPMPRISKSFLVVSGVDVSQERAKVE